MKYRDYGNQDSKLLLLSMLIIKSYKFKFKTTNLAENYYIQANWTSVTRSCLFYITNSESVQKPTILWKEKKKLQFEKWENKGKESKARIIP